MIYSQNKKLKKAYEKYLRSNARDLWDVYESYSHDKVNALDACVSFCDYYNGDNFRIISSDSFHFTAGFTCIHNGRRAFIYMTYSNNYCLYL